MDLINKEPIVTALSVAVGCILGYFLITVLQAIADPICEKLAEITAELKRAKWERKIRRNAKKVMKERSCFTCKLYGTHYCKVCVPGLKYNDLYEQESGITVERWG